MLRVTVLSCALCASGVLAGDLNPPPGPVAPSMKTLDAVEARICLSELAGDATAVRVITQTGSYYVNIPVLGEAGKDAIRIEAPDVTLDLNGFTLQGVPGSLDGIRFTPGADGGVVFGGTVQDFGDDGIDGEAIGTLTVLNTYSSRNALAGIRAGADATVRDSTMIGNGQSGVSAGSGLTALRVRVRDTAGAGIVGGRDSVVRLCVVDNSAAAGVDVDSGSMVFETRVTDSGAIGVASLSVGDSEGDGGLVERCVVTRGRDFGIDVQEGVVVRACVSDANASTGYRGFRSVFENCSASANEGLGFLPGGSRVSNCQATSNFQNGFLCLGGDVIEGCTARFNGVNGFQIQGGAVVRGCVAQGQANGRGISVEFATGAIVDGCTASQNQRGFRIDVASSNCVVMRSRFVNSTVVNVEVPGPALVNNRIAPIATDLATAGPLDNFQ